MYKNDLTGVVNVLATDDNRYASVAGYITVDPAHPLTANLVYNPQQ
jgi:hypothetical protein